MPFLLSRGGNNMPAEVQRWQYFLRKQNITEVGNIDGGFGLNTERATKVFQGLASIQQTGKFDARTLDAAQARGYTVLPNNHYSDRSSPDWPPRPDNLSTPDNATRNRDFKCFKFMMRPLSQRADKDEIVIKNSCDGTDPDWEAAQIITIDIPQLRFAVGYAGRFRVHRKAAPLFAALFAKWEADDLLHLVMSYAGCYFARYKRELDPPPPAAGHGIKKSTDNDASRLSNHSFGSAFDINVSDNGFGNMPAIAGRRGSVRELSQSANSLGIFWGGHFTKRDGMHFEIAKLPS